MSKYLTVNRLEFVITYLCNSNCKHCQITKEEKSMFSEHIDQHLATEIVRDVGETYHPESMMTFGGEPLLFPEIVCAIHREAQQVRIPRRQVITNGWWSKDVSKTNSIAKKLENAGVNEVAISVDSLHAENIPLGMVRETAKALLNVGIDNIKWNPSWVVSEDHDNEWNRKTKSILKDLSDLPVKISSGNRVKPEGNALVWLKEFLPERTPIPSGKCSDIPNTVKLDSVEDICIEPDGKIAICNKLHIGNTSQTSIIKLLEDYDPYRIREIKVMLEQGMEGLMNWAREHGVEPDPQGYYSICHLCTFLRKKVNEKMHKMEIPQ